MKTLPTNVKGVVLALDYAPYDRLALRLTLHADPSRGHAELSGGSGAAPVLGTACHRGSTQAGPFTALHRPVGERPASVQAVQPGPFARLPGARATGGRFPHSLLESRRLPLRVHPDDKAVAGGGAAEEPGDRGARVAPVVNPGTGCPASRRRELERSRPARTDRPARGAGRRDESRRGAPVPSPNHSAGR